MSTSRHTHKGQRSHPVRHNHARPPYQRKPAQILAPEKFRTMQAKGMAILGAGLSLMGVVTFLLHTGAGAMLCAVGMFVLLFGVTRLRHKAPTGMWKYIPLADLLRHDPLYVEQYVAGIFTRLGALDVSVTEQMSDGGIDVLMRIGNTRLGVQVKRYAPQHYVQVDEVRALLGSMHQLHLDKVVFVTTSQYTRYVWETIVKDDIYLIDGKTLDRLGQAARTGGDIKTILPGWTRFLM